MKTQIKTYPVEHFSQIIYKLLKSDRDVNIGVGGFTGEGKSTFILKMVMEYCKIAGIKFTFDFLTWNRDEMLKWIDGEGEEKKGRRPEFYPIVPDELFRMFYKRLWYEKTQIDAISVLNMCRDRHLLIAGAIPNFWNLDKAFISRVRFYVYINQRGEAYVFEQENNPFVQDVWNARYNEKLFRSNNIGASPNFLFKLTYEDLTDKQKKEYLNIRNEKRIITNMSQEEKENDSYEPIKRKEKEPEISTEELAKKILGDNYVKLQR